MSAFGFNDDLAGESLIWHEPEAGLRTISGLVSVLRQGSDRSHIDKQLIEELTAIEEALRKASDRGVLFCLLLRVGDGTSGREWEQRQGSCF